MTGCPTVVLQAFTAASDSRGWVELHHGEQLVERHEVGRWLQDADPVDLRVLRHCTGPTLDIGCGPGRLTAALTYRGLAALGVDTCTEAIALTRARGAAALRRDVFLALPGEGRWPWALLCDGNIGIGGDPVRLLRRVGELVAPSGNALVEVNPDEVDHRGTSRIRNAEGTLGAPFAWAVLGLAALDRAASAAGWHTVTSWRDSGRAFAVLGRGRDELRLRA
jgi:SAM-dependent methyltransferase